jgi:hypothetical protein
LSKRNFAAEGEMDFCRAGFDRDAKETSLSGIFAESGPVEQVAKFRFSEIFGPSCFTARILS